MLPAGSAATVVGPAPPVPVLALVLVLVMVELLVVAPPLPPVPVADVLVELPVLEELLIDEHAAPVMEKSRTARQEKRRFMQPGSVTRAKPPMSRMALRSSSALSRCARDHNEALIFARRGAHLQKI
jgi:hypothetical protein